MTIDRFEISPRERVDGFVSAYDHYKSEKLVQPLAEERKLEIIGEADQALSLRVRLQRASLLRKFILGKGDAHYLPKVHACLENLAAIPIDEISIVRLESSIKVLREGNVGPFGIVESADGTPTPDSQIVDDALNGILLHSDPEKMKRHFSRNPSSVNLAVFAWLAQAELLCEIMNEMCLQTIERLDNS